MDELKYDTRIKSGLFVALVILFFTLASLLSINQYQYGRSDSSISTPFVKAFLDNNLYPNDYMLAQRPYFYTYLWNSLGMLIKYTNISIPALFFLIYFISIYLLFWAIYLIAIILFGRLQTALLSLFFLLFAKTLPAGITTLDFILVVRTVALPILLFSIYFVFKGKYELSFLLQGLAFLIHPLSTVHVIIIILISSLVNLRKVGMARFLLCLIILLISASPILIWKTLHSPSALKLFYADPGWVELLRLRSPHHIFPFSWDRNIAFQAGLLLCVFFISWRYKPKPEHHRISFIATLTILSMCAMGIIFSELVPLSLVLTLQFLRSFQFLVYLAIIYFSNYFLLELESAKTVFKRLLAALSSIGILYGATGGRQACLALLGLSLFWVLWSFLYRQGHSSSRYFVSALLLIVFVLASGAYVKKRNPFTILNQHESSWLDVQIWAKYNTSIPDVFVVPPNIEGFRVESERTIYADWKDGGFLVLNPSFGYQWFQRMKNLGFRKGYPLEEGFKNLTELDFINIAEEINSHRNKIFLVMFKERGLLNFKIVYRNKRFIVYEIGA